MANNNREDLVGRLIRQQYNWIIGGYENTVQDGQMKQSEIPNREALVEEVYSEVMRAKGVEIGFGFFPTKKDIRFLGTARIKEMIQARFNKEGEY